MKLAIAGDSAGAELAHILADHQSSDYEVTELSNNPDTPDELYANLSDRVSTELTSGKFDKAILVCGTGIGVCISANKVPGIRAIHAELTIRITAQAGILCVDSALLKVLCCIQPD